MPLTLSAEQRAEMEAALRPDKAEQRIARRAQAVLLMADGVPVPDIAMVLGVHPRTVQKWRQRFAGPDPVAKLANAPRSGRPRSLSSAGVRHNSALRGDR